MDEFRYFIDGVGPALLNFRGSLEKINRNSGKLYNFGIS